MLSELEKDGVRQLLQNMPSAELVNLSNVVTNRLITVQSREDAIRAVSMYTDSAEQFLRRKLVNRDLLFLYLSRNNVVMSPSSDKSSLIRKTLECWASAVGSDGASAVALQKNVDLEKPRIADARGVYGGGSSSQEQAPSEHNSLWSQELAEQFSSWFFNQLNLLHPSRPDGSISDWGSQHFLRDAKLKLCVGRGSHQQMDYYEGADLVASRLCCLVTEEQLLFNPNLTSQGTKGCSDAHGLVIVVCGTIHQAGTCVGLFEQNLGLVQDPLTDNNWKVKFVNLQIR